MKKNIFASVAIAAICITGVGMFASSASALTVDDIQAQIKELLAKVADLGRQLNELRGQETTPPVGISDAMPAKHRICSVLYRNLSQGIQGDDVQSLQEFLSAEGYLSANATGYFGPMTAQAVAKWQSSEGVSAVGSFGPMSRERIKIWCGGPINQQRFNASPTRGEAPLTVAFSTWLSGFRVPSTYYTIDFGDGSSERAADCYAPADACQSAGTNTHTYSSNGTYTATLNMITNPCGGNPLCMAPVSQEVVGKVQVYVGTTVGCTKEYKPICGSKPIVCITTPCNPIQQTYSNRCMMSADGANFVHEGQCRTDYTNPADNPQCKSWFDGCNTCSRQSPSSPAMCTLMACILDGQGPPKPYCKEYFGNSGNRPPTISSFSGPTALRVNETGTWTIKASDLENGNLTYSVTWGDEYYAALQSVASMPPLYDVSQRTTFTHTYSSTGTYTVTVIVRDAAGQEAKTSTTIRVGGDAIGCTREYVPVCGRPSGCANTCTPNTVCTLECRWHDPVTYSNRCTMNAEGATLLYTGACQSSSNPDVGACTADAMQCPNGTWIGRTGPNCQFVCS